LCLWFHRTSRQVFHVFLRAIDVSQIRTKLYSRAIDWPQVMSTHHSLLSSLAPPTTKEASNSSDTRHEASI
jgi:hypothetical protein